MSSFFFSLSCYHRDLPVPTHSFPTLRSSDSRFVDRRSAMLIRRMAGGAAPFGSVGADGDIVVEGHRVGRLDGFRRSEEHTSELQSLMRISSAVFCLKKKNIALSIIH